MLHLQVCYAEAAAWRLEAFAQAFLALDLLCLLQVQQPQSAPLLHAPQEAFLCLSGR